MKLSPIIREGQVSRLLQTTLTFVDSPEFHRSDPAWESETLAFMPGHDDYHQRRRALHVPPGCPPEMAGHYLWPLLDREQERHLFRQMNYLRFLASRGRDRLTQGDLAAYEETSALEVQAAKVQDVIVNANRRLAVKPAQYATRILERCGHDYQGLFPVLLSEAEGSIFLASRLFDYMKGFKFSTYALWTIQRNLSRPVDLELRQSRQAHTGLDDLVLSGVPAPQEDILAEDQDRAEKSALRAYLGYLDRRARQVLVLRAGLLGGQPHSLEATGALLRLTRERIRQLETRAKSDLRAVARTVRIAPT